MPGRKPWTALALVLLLAGCLGAPAPTHDKAEAAEPLRIGIDVRGVAPPVVAWHVRPADTPLRQVLVEAAAAGAFAFPAATATVEAPASAGTVPLALPPGTWTVRARVVASSGEEATSAVQAVQVAATLARQLARIEAPAERVLADADGNGTEAVRLAGRVELAAGQTLRGIEWLEGDRVVASGLAATLWRPPGTYRFTLRVAYAEGAALGQQEAVTVVRVEGNGAPAVRAEALPDRWDADGDGTEVVALRGEAEDADGRIVSARWREGHHTVLATAAGNVTAAVGAHTYAFEAQDDAGAVAKVTRTVTVHPNRPPLAAAGPDQLHEDPEGDGSVVVLDASGSSDPDGRPLQFRWRRAGGPDVGTTAAVTLQLPRGVHTLEAVVRDAGGAEASTAVTVRIRAPLAPLAATFVPECDLMACRFAAQGSGEGPVAFAWDFGDGANATGATPTHTYTVPGRHHVVLTARDTSERVVRAHANVTVRTTWVVFGDDAEGPLTQWTRSSWFGQTGFVPMVSDPGMADHPNGTWTTTTAFARSGARSWTVPYPDQYNGTMLSVPVTVPADPDRPHLLTFWLRGGVENNPRLNVDGLHVYLQADGQMRRVAYITDDHPAWRPFEIPLDDYLGRQVQVAFSFQSDGFCSRDNTAVGRQVGGAPFGGCDPSSYQGYYIDDITVT